MLQVKLNYFYWEDTKIWVYFIFFFLVNFINFRFFFREKIKMLLILLHLSTLFSLPLIFLFKNSNWSFLILYFVFQNCGSIILEFGYSFFYFNSDYLIQIGLLLKLGLFPFLWWFPFFLKKNNWFNFFFFKTLNKISLYYLLSFHLTKEWNFFIVILISSLVGMWIRIKNILKKKSFKLFLRWRSLIDRVFFTWLTQINLLHYITFYFIYIFIQLIISLIFFFSFEKNVVKNQFFFKWSQQKKANILLGILSIFLLIGFPTFIIFLFKIGLVTSLTPLFNNYIYWFFFFFFFYLCQRLIYMKVFFNFLVSLEKINFAKYHVSFFFFFINIKFFNFFFFFFF